MRLLTESQTIPKVKVISEDEEKVIALNIDSGINILVIHLSIRKPLYRYLLN